MAKEKHAQWMAEQHLLIKRIAQDREEATKIKREAERAARAKRAAEQHLIELQARVDHLRAENRAEEIERRIRADQELLALQAKAENQMASRGISLENVKIDLASRRLHLLRDIKFVMGSCEFSDEEEAHELLEQVATAFDACNRELSLEGQPPLDLMVEGHTDTDNQELSKDRAEACKVYLVKRLQTIAEGDGEWGSLSEVKAVGHSNRVINRQAVVMRVVVPGEEAELPGTAVLPM